MAQKDWAISINVAGQALFEPGDAFERVPTGPYAAVIASSERDASKTAGSCDNIIFSLDVTEPSEKGKKLRIWMPIDGNVGEGIVGRKWKNLLVSVAKDPAVVEKGSVNINAKFFEKKPCFIYVQDVPGKDAKGRDNLQNLTFISKEMYEKFKVEGKGAAAGASATGSQGSMTVSGGATPNGTGAAGSTPHTAESVSLE